MPLYLFNILSHLGVTIETLSHPAIKLHYPAITVCRNTPYNPDEYVRMVFDNFQRACNYSFDETSGDSCQETEMLRQDFMDYFSEDYFSQGEIYTFFVRNSIFHIALFFGATVTQY